MEGETAVSISDQTLLPHRFGVPEPLPGKTHHQFGPALSRTLGPLRPKDAPTWFPLPHQTKKTLRKKALHPLRDGTKGPILDISLQQSPNKERKPEAGPSQLL